jgi:ATP/maltotriose-dependent transcriptional regulator MalT
LACVEGDYTTARALVEEGLAIRREVGDRWSTAISLISLGEVARCEGDNARAEPLFQEALALNRELGDHAGIAWALHNLGHVALGVGDARRAAALFAESLAVAGRSGYPQEDARCLAGLAGVALRLGQPERGARLLGAVEALLTSMHAVLAPADQLAYARDVTAARAQLDEATFTATWDDGLGRPLERAIAEALGGDA